MNRGYDWRLGKVRSIATDGKVIYDTALSKFRLSDAFEHTYDPFLNTIGTLLNYLPQSVLDKLLFYGLYSEIADGKMPNKVGGDWLTVAGSAGSETYQTPDTAPYIAADTDYIWFKTDESQRTTSTAELIGYDFPKTFVKYDNSTPYALHEIAILKAGETLTEAEENRVRDVMHLSNWWDGTLSLHGVVKGNRSSEKSTWTPESVAPDSPTGLTLTLISGGVKIDWTDTNAGAAQTEVWVKVNAGAYALLDTIAAGTVTKSDTRSPELLMSYKVRALKDGNYSDYTAEVTITMLGAEKVINGGMDTNSNWTLATGITISDGVMNFNTALNSYGRAYNNTGLVVGETYRIEMDFVKTGGQNLVIKLGKGQASPNYSASAHITWIVLCTSLDVDSTLGFGSNTWLVGTVDNVTCRKVLMP